MLRFSKNTEEWKNKIHSSLSLNYLEIGVYTFNIYYNTALKAIWGGADKSLALYRKQATGLKNVFTLHIPPELHTLMASLL
jgi:hypothetical protein